MTNEIPLESEGWYKLRYENRDMIGYILIPEQKPQCRKVILLNGFNEEFQGKCFDCWIPRNSEYLELLEKFDGVEQLVREIRKRSKDLTSMADEILLFHAKEINEIKSRYSNATTIKE